MGRIDLTLELPTPDLPGRVVAGHILGDPEVLEALEALAEACQIRPLESFFDAGDAVPARVSFGGPAADPNAPRWHDPAEGLKTIRTLAAGLRATLDAPGAVGRGVDDLDRFANALAAAAPLGIRFHLTPRD